MKQMCCGWYETWYLHHCFEAVWSTVLQVIVSRSQSLHRFHDFFFKHTLIASSCYNLHPSPGTSAVAQAEAPPVYTNSRRPEAGRPLWGGILPPNRSTGHLQTPIVAPLQVLSHQRNVSRQNGPCRTQGSDTAPQKSSPAPLLGWWKSSWFDLYSCSPGKVQV